MAHYLVAFLAAADLDQIWVYLDTEAGENIADAEMDRFHEQFQTLVEFPQMGRSRPQLGPSLRSFPLGSYITFYQPIDGGVEIVRVLHGSRDSESEFNA